MSAEESKAIVARVWEEFFIQGNLDKANEFFAPDYVNHDPAAPEDRHGPEELTAACGRIDPPTSRATGIRFQASGRSSRKDGGR